MPKYIVSYHVVGEQTVEVKNCKNLIEAIKKINDHHPDVEPVDFNINVHKKSNFKLLSKEEDE